MEKDIIKKDEKGKILDLKNQASVVSYLESLQSVISRMGGNSANIKALIAVVYTIFITILIAIKELKKLDMFKDLMNNAMMMQNPAFMQMMMNQITPKPQEEQTNICAGPLPNMTKFQ